MLFMFIIARRRKPTGNRQKRLVYFRPNPNEKRQAIFIACLFVFRSVVVAGEQTLQLTEVAVVDSAVRGEVGCGGVDGHVKAAEILLQ